MNIRNPTTLLSVGECLCASSRLITGVRNLCAQFQQDLSWPVRNCFGRLSVRCLNRIKRRPSLQRQYLPSSVHWCAAGFACDSDIFEIKLRCDFSSLPLQSRCSARAPPSGGPSQTNDIVGRDSEGSAAMVRKHASLVHDEEMNDAAWVAARGAAVGAAKV